MHEIVAWLLAAAFLGAGLFNMLGRPATRRDFVRWGYPAWWGLVTGALEIAGAVLIAVPVTRAAGLILGAAILSAAALTLLRHREFSHLAPVAGFYGLLALAAALGS
jgi:uncharacterized membrane protein YphA (DoxX/SURF4 family)